MSNLPGSGPSRILLTTLAAALGVLTWAPAAHADLTGHWRSPTSNAKVEIVQTGAAVVLNPSATYPCPGTIDGSDVALTCTNPSAPASYDLVVSGDEATLSGVLHTFQCVLSSCQNVNINVTFERCECFDGNAANGDGCDITCSVEVCNECSGDPSTCTPVADATGCEDPSLCVSGGSCSAGTCIGDVETAQCIDLSGTWLRGMRGTSGLWEGTGSLRSEFVQEADGSLTVFSLPSGYRDRAGSFDASTKALLLDGNGSWPNCGQIETTGSVATGGNRYAATGGLLAGTPHGCFGFAPYDEVGVRCAPAALEPPDGCSVDSCERCEGDPAVCEPVPDDTPCASSDPCAVVATCQAGQCVTALYPQCPPCQVCDGAGGCKVGPRTDCRDAATKLSIKTSEDGTRDSLRWDWKKGGAVEAVDIGHPELATSLVTFCLFDESAAEPVLLDSVFPSDSEGWSADDHGNIRFRSRIDAVSAIDLRVGNSPKLSLKTAAGIPGLPTPGPGLSTPLRAQLQISNGACFEGLYDGDDVRRNADGVFSGKTAAP